LEITENSLVKDLAAAGGVVSRLRKLGFAVEIDDFGTGFSSLSYLRYLMVDVLKIDRSFLIGYPHQDNGSLFKAIVGMAKDLGMTIIAEGVENKAQLELLESTDCEYYQGYLFAKALTPKEFMTLYAEAADIRH
jgi:EAL domain-containing protein (putative c-di-GMP-specific phosphodiesterase class I)